MNRKVVMHGPSTLTLSLPSQWVKRYNIKKGTELSINIQENNLIISPTETPKKDEKTDLDLDKLDRTYAKCMIRSAYRKGFDKIRITYSNPSFYHIRTDTYEDIKSLVRVETSQLIGFEITNITNKTIEITNLMKDDSTEFEKIHRKLLISVIDFLDYIITSIKQQKTFKIGELEERHRVTERLNNYCLRLINKTGKLPPKNERVLYHIISSIDIINNLLKFFARDILNNSSCNSQKKENSNKKNNMDSKKTTDNKNAGNNVGNKEIKSANLEFIMILNEIKSYFYLFSNLHFNFKKETIVEIGKSRKRIKNMILELSKELSCREIMMLCELKQIVDIVYHITEGVMELQHQKSE